MTLSVDLILTLAAFVGFAGLALLANWKADQPWDDRKPRRVPWRLVLILSGFALVLVLVHLVNLAGFETGPEQSPFGRF